MKRKPVQIRFCSFDGRVERVGNVARLEEMRRGPEGKEREDLERGKESYGTLKSGQWRQRETRHRMGTAISPRAFWGAPVRPAAAGSSSAPRAPSLRAQSTCIRIGTTSANIPVGSLVRNRETSVIITNFQYTDRTELYEEHQKKTKLIKFLNG